MRIVRELKGCRPIHEIFRQFAGEADAVFLDSSLKNSLGRYSIIGLHPYLKLVKGETFTANGIEQQEPFEAFVRRYLKENQEKNETNLPIVSGAVGYFSYDYGRKKEGVATRHGDETGIPDCVLVFYDDFILQDHEDGERLFLAANGKLRPAARRWRNWRRFAESRGSSQRTRKTYAKVRKRPWEVREPHAKVRKLSWEVRESYAKVRKLSWEVRESHAKVRKLLWEVQEMHVKERKA